MDPIRLNLTEAPGVCGVGEGWPLTRGVPLPEGAVHDAASLTVRSGDKALSTQTRALGRWGDGSIKWVLVDTQADRSHAELHLVEGPFPAHATPLQIEESDSVVTVDTGAIRFTIRRDRIGILEAVQVGSTTVTGDAGVELWARIHEGESLGGTKRRIYGIGGTCRAALASDAWSVEIEERGALRSVITCRGALELDAPMHHYAGYRPIHFVLRIHAFAGQPFVRLQYTTVMTLNPREVQVEEIGLRFHVSSAAAVEPRSATDEWLTLDGGDGGVGVALRHMREEGPKALRSTPDAIEALPYAPSDGERLDLSRYAEEVAWHEGEGIYSDGTGTAKTTELFVTFYDAGGAAVAGEQLATLLHVPHLSFEPAHAAACGVTGGFEPASDRFPASERMLAGVVEWLQRQIRDGDWTGFLDWGDVLIAFEESAQTWRYHGRWGWCNSEWDPRHGVWIQYLRTGDPALFALGESMTRHSVDVDTCHWHPFRPYFVGACYRHSVSHFSDEPCASHTFIDNWIDHYWLTGDLRTFEVIGETADFLLRYRWTEDPRFSFSLRGIANVLRGLLYVYEATGEEQYLRRAEAVYDTIARGQNEDGSWHKRFQVTLDRLPTQLPYGMATEGTTFAVEMGAPPFTDEEHLALAGGKGPIKREVPLDELKGYQTHYLLIGIELLHRLTGRDDVAEVYVRAVDWFCGGEPGGSPDFAVSQHYGGILCRHLAYAWRLTGKTAYLETGQAVLASVMRMQDRSDDPLKRGSLAMSPMYLSLVFFGVPFLLQALAEAGQSEPEPPA